MTRRAQRPDRVTVAELLVRDAPGHDSRALEDTVVLPRARHREKPPGIWSPARIRVFSVVAGALALTGGIGAAVSTPVERTAGAAWPPAGVEPPVFTPSAGGGLASRVTPDSVVKPAEPSGKTPSFLVPVVNSGKRVADPPRTAANLSRPKKNDLGKAKALAQVPAQAVAPVRHALPEPPAWSWSPRWDWRAWVAGWWGGCGGDGGGRHRR